MKVSMVLLSTAKFHRNLRPSDDMKVQARKGELSEVDTDMRTVTIYNPPKPRQFSQSDTFKVDAKVNMEKCMNLLGKQVTAIITDGKLTDIQET